MIGPLTASYLSLQYWARQYRWAKETPFPVAFKGIGPRPYWTTNTALMMMELVCACAVYQYEANRSEAV